MILGNSHRIAAIKIAGKIAVSGLHLAVFAGDQNLLQ